MSEFLDYKTLQVTAVGKMLELCGHHFAGETVYAPYFLLTESSQPTVTTEQSNGEPLKVYSLYSEPYLPKNESPVPYWEDNKPTSATGRVATRLYMEDQRGIPHVGLILPPASGPDVIPVVMHADVYSGHAVGLHDFPKNKSYPAPPAFQGEPLDLKMLARVLGLPGVHVVTPAEAGALIDCILSITPENIAVARDGRLVA